MAKRKNVSQKIPNGRTLQTRDEFFEGAGDYRKPGYENKGLYRKVIVIDSNRFDDLVVVKGSTKGLKIQGEKKTRFKPIVETKDDKGNPIKVGIKFRENKPCKDLSKRQVNQIKKKAYKSASKQSKINKSKTREIKGRK